MRRFWRTAALLTCVFGAVTASAHVQAAEEGTDEAAIAAEAGDASADAEQYTNFQGGRTGGPGPGRPGFSRGGSDRSSLPTPGVGERKGPTMPRQRQALLWSAATNLPITARDLQRFAKRWLVIEFARVQTLIYSLMYTIVSECAKDKPLLQFSDARSSFTAFTAIWS